MEVFGQQWWLTFFSWYSRLKTRGQLWWATLPTLGQLWMGSSLYSSTRHPIRASHSEMQIRIRHFRSFVIRHDKICSKTLGNYGRFWATMTIYSFFMLFEFKKTWATLMGNSANAWATMDGQHCKPVRWGKSLQFHQTPDPSMPLRNANQNSSLSFFPNPSR